MQIKQLIEILQKYQPETQVIVDGYLTPTALPTIVDFAFPIVGLITTLSLILAFLSNRRPIHEFRLKTRKFFRILPAEKVVTASYCLSFFLILIPYILKIFDPNYNFIRGLNIDLIELIKSFNLYGALLLSFTLFDTVSISFFSKAKYT